MAEAHRNDPGAEVPLPKVGGLRRDGGGRDRVRRDDPYGRRRDDDPRPRRRVGGTRPSDAAALPADPCLLARHETAAGAGPRAGRSARPGRRRQALRARARRPARQGHPERPGRGGPERHRQQGCRILVKATGAGAAAKHWRLLLGASVPSSRSGGSEPGWRITTPLSPKPREWGRRMKPAANPAALIARKEIGELILSQCGLLWLLAASLSVSAFALLLVGRTELNLLDNTQVVLDIAGNCRRPWRPSGEDRGDRHPGRRAPAAGAAAAGPDGARRHPARQAGGRSSAPWR